MTHHFPRAYGYMYFILRRIVRSRNVTVVHMWCLTLACRWPHLALGGAEADVGEIWKAGLCSLKYYIAGACEGACVDVL